VELGSSGIYWRRVPIRNLSGLCRRETNLKKEESGKKKFYGELAIRGSGKGTFKKEKSISRGIPRGEGRGNYKKEKEVVGKKRSRANILMGSGGG